MKYRIASMVVLHITVRCQIRCFLLNLDCSSRAEYRTLTRQLYRYRSTLLRHLIQALHTNRQIRLLVSHSKAVCASQVPTLRYIICVGAVLQRIGTILIRLYNLAALHHQYGSSFRNFKGSLLCCATTGNVDCIGTRRILKSCFHSRIGMRSNPYCMIRYFKCINSLLKLNFISILIAFISNCNIKSTFIDVICCWY